MLSVITMLSSMTLPMAIKRVTRVIMLSDSPNGAMTAKAPMKAIGRPRAAQSARRGAIGMPAIADVAGHLAVRLPNRGHQAAQHGQRHLDLHLRRIDAAVSNRR